MGESELFEKYDLSCGLRLGAHLADTSVKKSGRLNICDRDLVRCSLNSKLNVDLKNHKVLSVPVS